MQWSEVHPDLRKAICEEIESLEHIEIAQVMRSGMVFDKGTARNLSEHGEIGLVTRLCRRRAAEWNTQAVVSEAPTEWAIRSDSYAHLVCTILEVEKIRCSRLSEAWSAASIRAETLGKGE